MAKRVAYGVVITSLGHMSWPLRMYSDVKKDFDIRSRRNPHEEYKFGVRYAENGRWVTHVIPVSEDELCAILSTDLEE